MSKAKDEKRHRRSPSQARSRSSVQSITAASAQVLQQYGYKSATTNRIAERAGVSVGTLYQYFNNKDEIFDAMIAEEADHYLCAIEASIPKAEVPTKLAIKMLLEAGYSHNHLVLGMRVVMRNLPSTVYTYRSREIRQALHKLVVRFLELREPLTRTKDLAQTADVMIAMCEGLTFLGRVDRQPEELVTILSEALNQYLKGLVLSE